MSKTVMTSKIDRNYLRNKTKDELIELVMLELDQVSHLQELVETVVKHRGKNDGTSYPLFAISRRTSKGYEAWLAGPWFSREDAEAYLSAKSYNFPDDARVYTFSGCYSEPYKRLVNAATELAGLSRNHATDLPHPQEHEGTQETEEE